MLHSWVGSVECHTFPSDPVDSGYRESRNNACIVQIPAYLILVLTLHNSFTDMYRLASSYTNVTLVLRMYRPIHVGKYVKRGCMDGSVREWACIYVHIYMCMYGACMCMGRYYVCVAKCVYLYVWHVLVWLWHTPGHGSQLSPFHSIEHGYSNNTSNGCSQQDTSNEASNGSTRTSTEAVTGYVCIWEG